MPWFQNNVKTLFHPDSGEASDADMATKIYDTPVSFHECRKGTYHNYLNSTRGL